MSLFCHNIDPPPPNDPLHRTSPQLQSLGVHRHHGLVRHLRLEPEGGHRHHLGAGTVQMCSLGKMENVNNNIKRS